MGRYRGCGGELLCAHSGAIGMGKRGCASFFSPNCIDFPVLLFGNLLVGGIVSAVNPNYVVKELAFQLRTCGAKELVT